MQKRPKWNQKYRLSGRCHIGVQQGKAIRAGVSGATPEDLLQL